MPFYWRRRRKWWWRGNRRTYYKRRWTKPKRRRFLKSKRRRTTRRRRRRRGKVRRKQKKITVRQWQPNYITKCKIRGLQLFLLGAQGKQFVCYSDDKYSWTPPKAPGGGGFSAELYTLQYLYHEFKEGNNIWTRSNATKDLCRYLGCRFIFYRHPKTDFIIYYDRTPAKEIDKYTYSNMHPYDLLLKKRTKILRSRQAKPTGKLFTKIFVKPPKKMQTNWYFTSDFAEKPLLSLTVAAVDMGYSYISCCDTNQLLSLYALNTQYYTAPNWGKDTGSPYEPYSTVQKNFIVVYENKTERTFNMSNLSYKDSISYDKGWFQTGILKAVQLKSQNVIPTAAMRYNPTIDDGIGNAIWLKHVTQDNYNKPQADKSLIIEGKPLWKLLYGFLSYAQKAKPHEEILQTYILCISSPAIYPFKTKDQFHVPIDSTFINGKGPYEEYIAEKQKQLWYPSLQHQQQSINNIICCGPYIPKYNRDRESTWDLHGKYSFYFKWGGDDIQNQEVSDPSKPHNEAYNIPENVQVCDPSQQIPTTLMHAWDIRRGLLTPAALRRIQENLPIDETISDLTDAPPKKRRRKNNNIPYQEKETQEIQSCLQRLLEEDTLQEPQNQEDLFNLIQQQHQQQNLLKFNLLQLIADLKHQQKKILLHTGMSN
nr:MAG: ORF1 [Torque teno midi virus]